MYIRGNENGGVKVLYAQENAGTPGTPDAYTDIACIIDSYTVNDGYGTSTETDAWGLCDAVSAAALVQTTLGDRTISISLNRKVILTDPTEIKLWADHKAKASKRYLKVIMTTDTAVRTAEYEGVFATYDITGNIDQGMKAKPATSTLVFNVNRIITEP